MSIFSRLFTRGTEPAADKARQPDSTDGQEEATVRQDQPPQPELAAQAGQGVGVEPSAPPQAGPPEKPRAGAPPVGKSVAPPPVVRKPSTSLGAYSLGKGAAPMDQGPQR